MVDFPLEGPSLPWYFCVPYPSPRMPCLTPLAGPGARPPVVQDFAAASCLAVSLLACLDAIAELPLGELQASTPSTRSITP